MDIKLAESNLRILGTLKTVIATVAKMQTVLIKVAKRTMEMEARLAQLEQQKTLPLQDPSKLFH